MRKIIDDEESKFLKTLVAGEKLFNKAIKELPEKSTMLSGDVAWKLYDTYGFPVDLTQVMAEERGIQVDMEHFENLRTHASVSQGGFNLNVDFLETYSSRRWKVWQEMRYCFC